MQLTQLQDSNTLLTYSLMTTPAPVQVSPAQNNPSYAALTFVASNNTSGDVFLSKIVVQLPVGNPQQPDSIDLTEQPTGIRPSISPSAGWNTPSSPAPGVFVFTPASGQPLKVDAQGYAITLANIQVSTVVGTATVTLHETSSTSQTGPQQPSQCTISVPKFPYGFYVGNFAAQKPLVQNGQGAVLSWVGSENATYTMLWSTQSQNVSSVRQWTSLSLTDTTTFILQVQAQELGQTVTLYFSATVIVADPNITATLLDVLQTSRLQGAVTIGASGAPANLSLNGALSIDGALNATGNIAANGSVTSQGPIAAASGTSTLAALNVAGALQAGNVTTGGIVSASSFAGDGGRLWNVMTRYAQGNDTSNQVWGFPAIGDLATTIPGIYYQFFINAQVPSGGWWGLFINNDTTFKNYWVRAQDDSNNPYVVKIGSGGGFLTFVFSLTLSASGRVVLLGLCTVEEGDQNEITHLLPFSLSYPWDTTNGFFKIQLGSDQGSPPPMQVSSINWSIYRAGN